MITEIVTGESSNILKAKFDPATRVMEIEFKNRAGERASVYAYEDVSDADWKSFTEAKSRGGYFQNTLRPKYKSRRVS